jgi:hypothetical protein
MGDEGLIQRLALSGWLKSFQVAGGGTGWQVAGSSCDLCLHLMV